MEPPIAAFDPARKHRIMFAEILARLGVQPQNSGVYAGRWIERPGGAEIVSLNPATGQTAGPSDRRE